MEINLSTESAIECLKSNKPTSGYVMLQESIDMAINALEKQIPKKPIIETYRYTTLFICPYCERKQGIKYKSITVLSVVRNWIGVMKNEN